ncbi:MAG: amidohydrolase family protein [Dehalococcoidia bacterium]|nr:amidohydrolase family protein [Dehalococcoidia bacterium]
MKIDVFCHVTPPKFLKELEKRVAPEICKQLPCKFLPTLTDMPARFRIMDRVAGMVQVLTLTNPPIELLAEPKVAIELARIANDEMAELVEKNPDYFVGAVACLPMSDMDAALKEADRAIKELHHCGVQLFTHIMGKPLDSPEFMPLYDKMAEYDLPIWIHPFFQSVGVAKDSQKFDTYRVFAGEKDHAAEMERGSFLIASGTPSAMTRLIYGRIFDKHPNIKFITHHCGAYVPYFAGRIEMHYNMYQAREGIDHGFIRPILDYYKKFYGDTALHGNTSALMCGYAFFGASHMLFGTDMPFDAELGAWSTRKTVESIEKMQISEAEKKLIWEGNAKKLLRLPG